MKVQPSSNSDNSSTESPSDDDGRDTRRNKDRSNRDKERKAKQALSRLTKSARAPEPKHFNGSGGIETVEAFAFESGQWLEMNGVPRELFPTEYQGVILTTDRPSAQNPLSKLMSRTFAPNCGIPEDPVTGAAHTMLTPYWPTVLGIEKRTVIPARQASRRGGDLELCNLGGRKERCQIARKRCSYG